MRFENKITNIIKIPKFVHMFLSYGEEEEEP